MQVAVYQNLNGLVVVVFPSQEALDEGYTLLEIAKLSIPAPITSFTVSEENQKYIEPFDRVDPSNSFVVRKIEQSDYYQYVLDDSNQKIPVVSTDTREFKFAIIEESSLPNFTFHECWDIDTSLLIDGSGEVPWPDVIMDPTITDLDVIESVITTDENASDNDEEDNY